MGELALYQSNGTGRVNVETYLSFISDVGFPIVVTFYLLYRIEAKLDGVIDSIQRLPQQLFEQLKQAE